MIYQLVPQDSRYWVFGRKFFSILPKEHILPIAKEYAEDLGIDDFKLYQITLDKKIYYGRFTLNH